MQYTDHYNLNLPEGTDIVNPLVQDNPNYTAIDSALYANKLRVIGTATELTAGTVHALTRADQDIAAFKFVATSDYTAGDTFTVDGVSVTARIANGASLPTGAYKINSTVLCVLDGTLLNIINVYPYTTAAQCMLQDGVTSVESAINTLNKFSSFSVSTERGLIIFRKIGHTVFVTGVNTKFTSLPITFPTGFAPLENAIRAVGYINDQAGARGVILTNNQISSDGNVAVDWFNFTFSYLSNDAISS